MKPMKRLFVFTLIALAIAALTLPVFALSRSLPEPEIHFPKGYDTNRADQIHAALRSDKFKYLGGLVSYWEPEWGTILVYDGDAGTLTTFLGKLNEIKGVAVRVMFSNDLSKETGGALQAGSWWVKYSHTAPDTITVRINLAAKTLGGEKFELRLPKERSSAVTSEEEARFVTAVRKAFEARDASALDALTCWDRVPQKSKENTQRGYTGLIGEKTCVFEFKLAEPDLKFVGHDQTEDGVTYRANLPITKQLEVTCRDKADKKILLVISYPVGEKDGQLFLLGSAPVK